MKLAFPFLMIVFLLPFVGWTQIYVSPSGSDNNEGTIAKPLGTVAMALRKAREMRRLNDPVLYPETPFRGSLKSGIEIIVGDGVYKLSEPLFIRPEDSGTEESPTIIKAATGARPILSGGIEITGWKKLQSGIVGLPSVARGKIWVADMPTTDLHIIRQLWVNDQKATRAKDRNGNMMSRILSWDKVSQTCWIPNPKSSDLSKAKGMEMFIHQWWAIAILRIKGVKKVGDSIQLSFQQPESRIQSEHPWPDPWISKKTGNSAFFLTNAIQFLDEPGEWFLDLATRKIYYYPRANENMNTAKVVAPLMESLVRIKGTIDHPVSHIFFKGISFQHTGWLRPSQQGHVPLQAGMFLLDAYKLKIPGTPDKKGLENQGWIGRPAAAVEVSYANHTGFENCRFEHLASTGLDYKKGTNHDEINGNLFKDIGGSGILIGTFSDESFETHLPYNPKDEREVCSDEHISNNLVTDVTNEDWGCVGIGTGFVKRVTIEHNQVSNVSYTGISVGWGWTKTENAMRENRVIANKITHYAKHMYDVAGIYTLSAQPGTIISRNHIDSIYKAPYAHDPNHWFYLYTDEGSSYITVKDNWCPSEKFLQNANGPGNDWVNNGPMVSNEIKSEAGLESKYRDLLNDQSRETGGPIQHFNTQELENSLIPYAAVNRPLIIEVISKNEGSFNLDALLGLLKPYGILPRDVYQWKNHIAAFGKFRDSADLKKQIHALLPGVQVKLYSDMFYVFQRGRCSDNEVANNWENVILTANLVAEARLQREYLDYHANQFEKWPEVSNGFCKADFQQLLLFRNGRQLMLVISIPKGKSLDELNPKTIENNPRVAEWNAIMKKYQEGISGTQPGEVWVFLKPVEHQ